jgi:hypothetical protein
MNEFRTYKRRRRSKAAVSCVQSGFSIALDSHPPRIPTIFSFILVMLVSPNPKNFQICHFSKLHLEMGREPPNKLGPRKRVRKRKRRAVSSSSSSSSSSSDSDTGAVPQKPKVLSPVREPVLEASVSESSSDSDSDTSREAPAPPDAIVIDQPIKDVPSKRISPSPSPPPRVIPSFIPPINGTEKDIQLKDRFRKFWMESIADGFRDDLEEIHKVRFHDLCVPISLLLLILRSQTWTLRVFHS